MDDFRALFDSDKSAYNALQDAAQSAYDDGIIKVNQNGIFEGEARININGLDVDIIGGRLIKGKFNLGSASRQFIE